MSSSNIDTEVEKILTELKNNEVKLKSLITENEGDEEFCKQLKVFILVVKYVNKLELQEGIGKVFGPQHESRKTIEAIKSNIEYEIKSTELYKNHRKLYKNITEKTCLNLFMKGYKNMMNKIYAQINFNEGRKLIIDSDSVYDKVCRNEIKNKLMDGGFNFSKGFILLLGVVSLVASTAKQISATDGLETLKNENKPSSSMEITKRMREDPVGTAVVVGGTVAVGVGTVAIGVATAPISAPVAATVLATSTGTGITAGWAVWSLNTAQDVKVGASDQYTELSETLGALPQQENKRIWEHDATQVKEILGDAQEWAQHKLPETIKELKGVEGTYYTPVATERQKEAFFKARMLYKTYLETDSIRELMQYSKDKRSETLYKMDEKNQKANKEELDNYIEKNKDKITKFQDDIIDIVEGEVDGENKGNFNKFITLMRKIDSFKDEGKWTLADLTITQEEMEFLEEIVINLEESEKNVKPKNKRTKLVIVDRLIQLEDEIRNDDVLLDNKNEPLAQLQLFGILMTFVACAAYIVDRIYPIGERKRQKNSNEKNENDKKSSNEKNKNDENSSEGGKNTKKRKNIKKKKNTKKKSKRKNTRKKVFKIKNKRTRNKK
jgi:hypothetical protein